MARIGIYGGSFNPPHRGHILAARECCTRLALDRLIFIPDAEPPHKTLAPGSPDSETRLALVKLAAQDVPMAEVSDMELRRDGRSYTADTVRQLRQQYPEDELTLLMGTDMYLSFDQWREPDVIANAVTLACMYRSGADSALLSQLCRQRERLAKTLGARSIFAENEALDISSTQVRRMLFFGCADAYLQPQVLDAIKTLGLYGTNDVCAGLDFETLKEKSLSLHKPKRVPHAIGCSETSALLARRFGADETAAARAGILHDVTKALTTAEQRTLCRYAALTLTADEETTPALLHAKTGAWAAETIFGEPREICDAIRWHTTGKACMTTLEKIVYLADMIEPTREYPGVDEIRAAAELDLDRAVLLALERTIAYLRERGFAVCEASIQARDFLLSERN